MAKTESKNSDAASGGIGVTGLLGVAFVVLKLTHVIQWSWWWVTGPFWIPPAILLTVLTVVAAVYIVLRIIVAVLDAR